MRINILDDFVQRLDRQRGSYVHFNEVNQREKKWCACATSQSTAKINFGKRGLIIPRDIFTLGGLYW